MAVAIKVSSSEPVPSGAFLYKGRINVGLLRDEARRQLSDYLTKLEGNKVGPDLFSWLLTDYLDDMQIIVWDPDLMGSFNLIADYKSYLKSHGVIQMFTLALGKLQSTNKSSDHIIYIVRPSLRNMKTIADNVKREDESNVQPSSGFRMSSKTSSLESAKEKRKFHLLFMPRGSMMCEKKLTEFGVFGDFLSVNEYPVIYPVDCDVLSLEMNFCFKEVMVERDNTSIYDAACSLMKIQSSFGRIPKILGLGKMAKNLADLLLKMRNETSLESKVPMIDELIIIDRNVDLITPLLTPNTYEGLIDQFFKIKHNSVKLPSDKFHSDKDSPESETASSTDPDAKSNFSLSSAEELFVKLRDKNFSAVGPFLSTTSKQLSQVKLETTQAKSVQDLKQILQKIPLFQIQKQSVATHITIAELVKHKMETDEFSEMTSTEREFVNCLNTDRVHPYIEEMISKKVEIETVLRLICLQSCCNSGLKKQVADYYKREIIQTYGFNHILTLEHLERVGLFRTSTSSSTLGLPVSGSLKAYPTLRKLLRLTVDTYDDQNPRDLHHVYGGYAPLSIRMIEQHVRPGTGGWRSIPEVLKLLPEPSFEMSQDFTSIISVQNKVRRGSGSGSPFPSPNVTFDSRDSDPKMVLVVFLGGVTYAEISALRFLSTTSE